MKKLKSDSRKLNTMIRAGIFCTFIYFISLFEVNAQVITVKQDGTGDFTVIQTAIDSSTNGDTVLVWPGTYYENINFNGKSITLGSLNLTTNDPSYINQTIIDGNYSESCLKVITGETVEITGFKITHGIGDFEFFERGDGAGLFTYNSVVTVKNCIIIDNDAWSYGGGIYNAIGTIYLSGTTICHNHAKKTGGGLLADCLGNSVIFDSVNRCNIYLNFSGGGCDIFHPGTDYPLNIILDTFTVLTPDRYHIETVNNLLPDSNYIFDALHTKIGTASADLYVSPSGDNSNSGLTLDQPLKTLAFALTKIVTNPDSNRKIYLSNGIYSKNTNGEKFPINIRGYVDIIGESQESTILDADSMTYFFEGNKMIHNYSINNLTLLNGFGHELWDNASGIILTRNYSATYENITAKYGKATFSGCMCMSGCNNIVLKNFNAYDHTGGFGTFRIFNAQSIHIPYTKDTISFINCRIKGTMPSPQGVSGGNGGGIRISGPENRKDTVITAYIIGSELVENKANSTNPIHALSAIALHGGGAEVYLINSTIGNNGPVSGPNSAAVGFSLNTRMYIYNSILFGNWPPQIIYGSTYPDDTCGLYIYNSLIEDGENGIVIQSPWNNYHYDPTSIDTDPLWDTTSMYPYSLSEGSPCIDAGTLNLPPDIELPEYDIAGNPRIWGESVDMGAYEYGPWVRVPSAPGSIFKLQSAKLLTISPNPFSYGTYISYEMKEKGRVNIRVYSLTGKKVRTLINCTGSPKDTGKFYWDGCDQDGNNLSSGTYIIRMTVDDKLVEALKMVKSD